MRSLGCNPQNFVYVFGYLSEMSDSDMQVYINSGCLMDLCMASSFAVIDISTFIVAKLDLSCLGKTPIV
jgi:hypothetical protein